MDVQDGLDLYTRMCFLRQFEERADVLYRRGLIHGPLHLGLGHEAIAVGAASVLRPGDCSLGTYRGHAHALARGAPPDAVLAELLGRAGGICGGKGGSMHITSVPHGYYGSYAIVGAHLPVACGLAWAAKIRRTGQVTVCFFGDGATNIGAFHEAVNLAAVWRLPVVFVCENNWYMEYTPIADVIPVALPAADRASAYGLDRIVVDGNDVTAVRDVVGAAVTAARDGRGPSLVEAQTYRLKGHSAADAAAYRPAEEVARWRDRDPLLLTRTALVKAGTAEAVLDEIDARTKFEPGRAGPAGARAAGARAGRRLDRCVERRERAMAELTYRQAVSAALAQEMARDDRVVLLGEDVASGGVFKTTTGLRERFGADRVWNTPISEQAIAGAAMGAAMGGLRPVAEIMFSDFYATCWDQVANEIAKVRYMTGGQVGMPLVLRGANGSGGLGFGSQHGQSVENWAMCVPGLKIVSPASPAEAFGLIAGAIRDDNPVLVFEHKALYGRKERRWTGSTCCRLAGPASCGRAATSPWSGCPSPSAPAWPPPTSSAAAGRFGRGHRLADAGAAGRRRRARLGGPHRPAGGRGGESRPARLGRLGGGHRGAGGVRLAHRPGHQGQRRQRAAAGGGVPRSRSGRDCRTRRGGGTGSTGPWQAAKRNH